MGESELCECCFSGVVVDVGVTIPLRRMSLRTVDGLIRVSSSLTVRQLCALSLTYSLGQIWQQQQYLTCLFFNSLWTSPCTLRLFRVKSDLYFFRCILDKRFSRKLWNCLRHWWQRTVCVYAPFAKNVPQRRRDRHLLVFEGLWRKPTWSRWGSEVMVNTVTSQEEGSCVEFDQLQSGFLQVLRLTSHSPTTRIDSLKQSC